MTLEIAAGVGGFVALSMQLVKAAQELHGLALAYKSAEDMLKALALELETLAKLLQQAEQLRSSKSSRCGDALQTCLSTCNQSVKCIKKVTEDLGSSLKRSGILGRFIIAFKSGEIASLRIDLDSAKATLLIACNVYFEAMRHRDNEALSEQIQMLRRSHRLKKKIKKLKQKKDELSLRLKTLFKYKISHRSFHKAVSRSICQNGMLRLRA